MEQGELPEWFSRIPMHDTPIREYIEVDKDFLFPLDVLRAARTMELGSQLGLLSFVSEALRQKAVELSEKAGWRDLPTTPTSAIRTAEDSWKLTVGDKEYILDAQEFDALLARYPETDA